MQEIVSPELLTDACASQPSKMADHHERRFDTEPHLANKHRSSRTKYKRKAREIIRMAGKSSPLSSRLTHARRDHPRRRTITNADLMQSPICWSNNDHPGPNTREKRGKSSEWPENRLPWAPDWRMRVATIQDGGPSRTQIWCRAPSADPTTIIQDQIQEKSAGNHQNGRKIVSPELLTDACASQPSKMADHHERRFDAEPHLANKHLIIEDQIQEKSAGNHQNDRKIVSPELLTDACASQHHPSWGTFVNTDNTYHPDKKAPSRDLTPKITVHHERRFDAEPHPKIDEKSAGNHQEIVPLLWHLLPVPVHFRSRATWWKKREIPLLPVTLLPVPQFRPRDFRSRMAALHSTSCTWRHFRFRDTSGRLPWVTILLIILLKMISQRCSYTTQGHGM